MEQMKRKFPANTVEMLTKFFKDLKGALAASIQDVFLAGIIVVAIALVLVIFLKELPLRKDQKLTE